MIPDRLVERTGPVTLPIPERQKEKVMSINVYLSGEVRELPEYKSQPGRNGTADQTTIFGEYVYDRDSTPYISWREDNDIPDALKNLVVRISCHEEIPRMGPRESGVYRHGSAVCELTPGERGNSRRELPVYSLRIIADNMEDLRAILHMVKTGAIRPEESYEGRQNGKSRKQLENELMQTQQQLGGALATIRELRGRLSQRSVVRRITNFLSFFRRI